MSKNVVRRWWSNSHMVRFLTSKMKSTSKLTKVYTKSKSERKKHKGSHKLTTKIRVGKREKKKRTYNKALALVVVGS